MNTFAGIIIAILCAAILCVPRRFAVYPLFICLLYITRDQVITFAGLSLYGSLILSFFGILRLIIKQEIYLHDTDNITLFVMSWAVISIIANFVLYDYKGDLGAIRVIVTGLMVYIYSKSIFRSIDDIAKVSKALPILIAPVAFLMLLEFNTGRSIFSNMNSVPIILDVRNGKFRCQGPFSHPILAGTFGATVMPLIVAMWFQKNVNKIWPIIGIISSLIIVVTSVSGGALTILAVEVIGFGCFYINKNMRWIRRGIVAIVVLCAILMKAPIWYLSAKLSDLTGGTGWHRSYLLDVAFGKYFHEWWLLGTKYTAHWMPYFLAQYSNKADITNEYLNQGVNGGILSMALYIMIIVICFKAIGKSFHKKYESLISQRMLLWALGVTLIGHAVGFMSISYFDQSIIWYNLLLGMIGAVSAAASSSTENNSVKKHI